MSPSASHTPRYHTHNGQTGKLQLPADGDLLGRALTSSPQQLAMITGAYGEMPHYQAQGRAHCPSLETTPADQPPERRAVGPAAPPPSLFTRRICAVQTLGGTGTI